MGQFLHLDWNWNVFQNNINNLHAGDIQPQETKNG